MGIIFRLQQLGLCLLVLLAFVALLELGERSSGFFDLVNYPDSGLLRYRAGSTIRWGREGYGVTTIGPDGTIGAGTKSTGAQVLFLGDSFTESLQVDENEKFTALVGERYSRRWPQQPIATLNFALSGLSAVQYAADLPGLRRVTQPRLVIVQLGLDDFLPQACKTPNPTQRAYLTETSDGNLTLRTAPLSNQTSRAARLKQFLIQKRLFSVYARISWRLQNLLGPHSESAEDSPAASPKVAPATVAANESTPSEEQRITRFLLNRMKEECQAAGASLVLLYTSRIPQLQRGHILWDETELGAPVIANRDSFFAIARELNIPVLDPTARLVEFARATGRMPYGFANNRPGSGHLNQDGHSVVADFMVDELPALLPPAN